VRGNEILVAELIYRRFLRRLAECCRTGNPFWRLQRSCDCHCRAKVCPRYCRSVSGNPPPGGGWGETAGGTSTVIGKVHELE